MTIIKTNIEKDWYCSSFTNKLNNLLKNMEILYQKIPFFFKARKFSSFQENLNQNMTRARAAIRFSRWKRMASIFFSSLHSLRETC